MRAARPSTVPSPSVGATRPSSIAIVVVLPAPLGPTKPATTPAGTSIVRPSTATRVAVALRQAAQRDRRAGRAVRAGGRGRASWSAIMGACSFVRGRIGAALRAHRDHRRAAPARRRPPRRPAVAPRTIRAAARVLRPDDAPSSARTRSVARRGGYRRSRATAARPARDRRPARRGDRRSPCRCSCRSASTSTRRSSTSSARLLLTLPLAVRRRAPFAVARRRSPRPPLLNAIVGGGLFQGEPPPFPSLDRGRDRRSARSAPTPSDRPALIGAVPRRRRAVGQRDRQRPARLQSLLFSGGLVVVTPWLVGRSTRVARAAPTRCSSRSACSASASPWARSGRGSRASCTTSSRTASARWSCRRRARGACSTATPSARARRSRRSSARAATRSTRCAARSACCAGTGADAPLAPQPGHGRPRRARRAGARERPRRRARRPRASPRRCRPASTCRRTASCRRR